MSRLSIVNTAAALLITLLAGIACRQRQERTMPVQEAITESVYASGIVKSSNQYQVFAAAGGLVAEIYVNEGDTVKKGQPVMRLSNAAARLNTETARITAAFSAGGVNPERLAELRSNVEAARLKMESDASLLQRQRNLWSQQIGSSNDVDQRELAWKNSAAAHEQARLRLAQAQKQMDYETQKSRKALQVSQAAAGDYTIKSETAGRVYGLLKEKGEMVTTQAPVAIIGDAGTFVLELQVDEYDIGRLRIGQRIALNMNSYKGQVFEAVLTKIYPLMNERSRSFTAEAGFVKPPPALYPNLTCEANIIIQEKPAAITIPRAYLMEGDTVILENRQKRKVITGLKDYRKVEVVSGLTVTDVILKPPQ